MCPVEEIILDGSEQVDDIFEILVTSYTGRVRAMAMDDDLNWRPATDAYATEDEFVVQMDMAGMEPSAIEVMTDGQTLTVKGARNDIAPGGKKHYFKMEISVGPFARRMTIPVPVVAESATARYQGGFLYVTFRRGDPGGGDRRRIDVNGANSSGRSS